MPVTLLTNIASLGANRRLTEVSARLSRDFDRLSSGLRINRASDDAAGLAIASDLKVDTRVFNQGVRNLNDGISALSIAEGALKELAGIAVRHKELAEQAANGVYSSKQREALNNEANALVAEYNRIVEGTAFNRRYLLDNSFQDVRVQAGYGANAALEIGIGELLARNSANGEFGAPADFGSGNAVNAIEALDFNGDGNLDVLATITGQAKVFLGRGDGTFLAERTYALAGFSGTFASVVRDWNGDGVYDIVASQGGSNAFGVLFGNADGSFRAAVSYAANSGVAHFTSGDVNGDGREDLVLASATTYDVILGNGNGTFRASVSYNSATAERAPKLLDLNGDGALDMVATNANTTGTAFVFIGNGNGTFRAPTSYLTLASTPRNLRVQDLNNDGQADMLVVHSGGLMTIRLGSSDGSFGAATSFASNAQIFSLTLEDINDDGELDILANGQNDRLITFFGNGNGSFKAMVSYGTNDSRTLVIGDFDNDEVKDIVVGNSTADNLSTLLGESVPVTTINELDLRTQAGARLALTTAGNTLNRVNKELGNIGALSSRFQVAINSLTVGSENFSAAASQIMDVDVASQTAELTRNRILQQSSAFVLAQANQLPALALELLS